MGFEALLEHVPALRKGSELEQFSGGVPEPMIAEFLRPQVIGRPRRLRPNKNVRPFLVVGTEGISIAVLHTWAEEINQRDGIVLVISIDNEFMFGKLKRALGKMPYIVLRDDTPLEDALGLSEYPCFVDPEKGVIFQ